MFRRVKNLERKVKQIENLVSQLGVDASLDWG